MVEFRVWGFIDRWEEGLEVALQGFGFNVRGLGLWTLNPIQSGRVLSLWFGAFGGWGCWVWG